MHFASYFSRCSSLFFLFCLANGYCLAQFNLSGTVIDRAKGTPVEAVHVFLENTTLGTLTDEQGRYEFKEIPNGVYKLIVSHLAYNTVDMTVRTPRRTPYILDFKLFPSSIDLSAVEVTSKKSRKRNRYLKEFTSAILGNTPNGAKCRLLNPEQVLLQKEADGRLTASAKGILKFENKSTGYFTYFLLEDFASINNQISYAGKTFFEALESSDPKEARRWAKNRKVTFHGSVRHFYLSLMQNRLTQDGFEIYKAKLQDNKKFVTTGRADPKQLIKQNGDNYQLQFDDFLKVVYTREGEIDHAGSRRIGRSAKQLSQRAESDLVDQESGSLGQKRKKQTSWLFARKSKIDISPEGFPTKPGSVVEYGYWNEEGLADFLPLEYSPKAATIVAATDVPAEEQPAPERNGFQLTQLKIPLADIQSGGPPRDGIPSIDRPSFIGASDIGNVLRKDERILGIYYNGIAKAYPTKILDRHEVVNDHFGNEPVLVTYCPLCRSGMAFLVKDLEGQSSFGVSGLLYNSDVLLYDRQTASLWSQILGEAVSGPMAGTKLPVVAVEQTSWGQWYARHPESQVLDQRGRDYSQKAYAEYEQSGRLMFPVNHRDKRLPEKALVIGIEINGQFKAYAFRKLRKHKKEVLEDTFNGQKLQIHYNSKGRYARITDESGKILPAVSMYWFAWSAFHPETALY